MHLCVLLHVLATIRFACHAEIRLVRSRVDSRAPPSPLYKFSAS